MDNKTLTSASTPYIDMVYGTAENDCLVPCQTTEITCFSVKNMNPGDVSREYGFLDHKVQA